MSEILRLINIITRKILSKESHTKLKFYYLQKYRLDLKSPKTFSEKMQWIKLYGDLESENY